MKMPPLTTEHPLQSGYVLWVIRRQKHHSRAQKSKKQDVAVSTEGEHSGQEVSAEQPQAGVQQAAHDSVEDYEKLLKKVASFSTVEQFWKVYGHVQRPHDVAALTDLHVFKEGIKPAWEDPANRRGGRVVVRVKKNLGSRYWELLLLGMIGEHFTAQDPSLKDEICGAVISVRHNEDILSLWTRTSDNPEIIHKVKDLLKKCIKLPGFVPVEYKRHDTAAIVSAAPAGGPKIGDTGGFGAAFNQETAKWSRVPRG